MTTMRTIAQATNIVFSLGEGQTSTYRTANLVSEKFGNIEVVLDLQHETKTIELFVPMDKKEEFKNLLDNIDLGYKHKANGLQFTFDKVSPILTDKINYYIKKLS